MLDNDALFVWAAQIINFLILVALLRKFLYRPVLDAIANRQREIASRVESAEKSEQKAEQLAASCRQKEQELEAARETILAEARQEIENWKQEALAQARNEVEQTQSHWWEALHRERERFLQQLRERAGRQVHQVTRHVLRELANADLERQMVEVFLDRLEAMDKSNEEGVSAKQHPETVCTLTTALPLSEDLQAEIRQQLQRKFGELPSLHFEQDADLICGVEFQRGDHRLSWNVADTIESMERNFVAALNHPRAESPARNVAS